MVSFGISGPIIELLGDWAYRIPPLGEHDVAAMVREVKSSPLLFGYRGAEPVDVERSSELITRVAQLQNDLPEVQRARAVARARRRADGATVLTASVRLAPVRDPRPDSFVRRLPDATVTLPRVIDRDRDRMRPCLTSVPEPPKTGTVPASSARRSTAPATTRRSSRTP